MHISTIKQFALTFACVLVCTTGAVASENSNKADPQQDVMVLSLTPNKVKNVQITNAETLTISGKVRKIHKSNIRGHVDFAIFDEAGGMIQKGSVGYTPSLTGGGSRKEARFHANLPGTEGKADLLVVSYHGKGGGRTKVYDCGDNIAITE